MSLKRTLAKWLYTVVVLSTLCGSFSVLAYKTLEPAPILQLDRAGPVFEKPSSKAKILADAPEGMLVLGRSLSPRDSWILIEDESGFQGWFPKKWTNWSSVHQTSERPQHASLDQAQQLPSGPEEAEKEFRKSTNDRANRKASAWFGGWGLGVDWKKSLNLEKLQRTAFLLSYMNRDGRDRFGFFALWGPWNEEWGLSFLSRFAWGSQFFREIDFGFRKRQEFDTSISSADLGFSVGAHLTSQLVLGLRGGLQGFSDSQWSVSGRLAWHF